MMKTTRTLQKFYTGRNDVFSVYLPIDWIRKQDLTKGDKLILIEKDDGSLIIKKNDGENEP